MDVSPQQIKVLTLQFHDGKPKKKTAAPTAPPVVQRDPPRYLRERLFLGECWEDTSHGQKMGVTRQGSLETPWPATENPVTRLLIDR